MNASHKYEDAVKHFKDYGVIVSDVKVDWKVMMGQKDKAVSVWRESAKQDSKNELLLETLKRLKVKL